MASDNDSLPRFSITSAEPSQIDSLATITARAFHPVNPFIKSVLPDTPPMRAWFSRAFLQEIENSDKGHPIIARENATNEVVGILALRLMGSDERGSGMWTKDLALDPEQEEKYNDMVDSMTQARERLMLGTPHYLIQLFGVDQECKGLGLGQRLLEQACYTADEDDYAIFVQSNKYTKDLYVIHGFFERDVVKMPKDPNYTEHMMMRPKRSELDQD